MDNMIKSDTLDQFGEEENPNLEAEIEKNNKILHDRIIYERNICFLYFKISNLLWKSFSTDKSILEKNSEIFSYMFFITKFGLSILKKLIGSFENLSILAENNNLHEKFGNFYHKSKYYNEDKKLLSRDIKHQIDYFEKMEVYTRLSIEKNLKHNTENTEKFSCYLKKCHQDFKNEKVFVVEPFKLIISELIKNFKKDLNSLNKNDLILEYFLIVCRNPYKILIFGESDFFSFYEDPCNKSNEELIKLIKKK